MILISIYLYDKIRSEHKARLIQEELKMKRYLTPSAQITLVNTYHKKVLECNQYIREAKTEADRKFWYEKRHYYITKMKYARKGYTYE